MPKSKKIHPTNIDMSDGRLELFAVKRVATPRMPACHFTLWRKSAKRIISNLKKYY